MSVKSDVFLFSVVAWSFKLANLWPFDTSHNQARDVNRYIRPKNFEIEGEYENLRLG